MPFNVGGGNVYNDYGMSSRKIPGTGYTEYSRQYSTNPLDYGYNYTPQEEFYVGPGQPGRSSRTPDTAAYEALMRKMMQMGGGQEFDPHAPRGSEFSSVAGGGTSWKGMPSGNYTLAKYPGLEYELWKQERGFPGSGYMFDPHNITPKQTMDRDRMSQRFVNVQREMLGIDGGNSRMSAAKNKYRSKRRR